MECRRLQLLSSTLNLEGKNKLLLCFPWTVPTGKGHITSVPQVGFFKYIILQLFYIDWCIHFLVFHINLSLLCHGCATSSTSRPPKMGTPRAIVAATACAQCAVDGAGAGATWTFDAAANGGRDAPIYRGIWRFDRLWHASESLCESVKTRIDNLCEIIVYDILFSKVCRNCYFLFRRIWNCGVSLAQGPQNCCWRSPGINGVEDLQLQRRCLAWGSCCWWHPLAVAGHRTGKLREALLTDATVWVFSSCG